MATRATIDGLEPRRLLAFENFVGSVGIDDDGVIVFYSLLAQAGAPVSLSPRGSLEVRPTPGGASANERIEIAGVATIARPSASNRIAVLRNFPDFVVPLDYTAAPFATDDASAIRVRSPLVPGQVISSAPLWQVYDRENFDRAIVADDDGFDLLRDGPFVKVSANDFARFPTTEGFPTDAALHDANIEAYYVPRSLVRRVIADMGAGDDQVRFNNTGLNLASAHLIGGRGNDVLDSTAPTSLLSGGDGDDQLDAQDARGSATLEGGAGRDRLRGSAPFADSLIGGDGDDELDGGESVASLVRGGATAKRATRPVVVVPTLPTTPILPTPTPTPGSPEPGDARRGVSDLLDGGGGTDRAVRDDDDRRSGVEALV